MEYLKIKYNEEKSNYEFSDCIGFVILYLKNEYNINFDIDLNDLDYNKESFERLKDEVLIKNFYKIKKEDLKEGDLVLHCGKVLEYYYHLAVYYGNGKIIHAKKTPGVVKQNYIESESISVSHWRYKNE